MRVSLQLIRSLEDFIDSAEHDALPKKYLAPDGEENPWAYFAERPEILVATGFDEFVAFRNKRSFRAQWFADGIEDSGQSIYREPSGKWHLLYQGPQSRDGSFLFKDQKTWSSDDEYSMEIRLKTVFTILYNLEKTPTEDSKTLWSPTLWTPDAQENTRIYLQSNIKAVLQALKQEEIHLESVTWRQLEEIVAEVLRAKGMEIHLVRENPQGGRDIVARGELIPGQEPLLLAVEVKHRRIVDRPELDKALWQNRHFPALMFVTSGRFTSGVLKEKAAPENKFRLFLKDGEALDDLVRAYPLQSDT